MTMNNQGRPSSAGSVNENEMPTISGDRGLQHEVSLIFELGRSGMTGVDIPEVQMPHANSLSATTQQLSLGLGVAAATIALRLGGPIGHLFTGAATAGTAYTVAFALIALLPLAATLGIARLDREAGSATRTARTVPDPPTVPERSVNEAGG